MAGLLLAAVGCTPLAGCLFPQDEQVLGELPPKRNAQVRIIPGRELPAQRVTFFNSTMCTNEPFRLSVEDEDVTDVLSSQWFIGKTTNEPFRPSNVPGGSAARSVTAPTSLGFKSALSNLTAGTTEQLIVYVADRPFRETLMGVVSVENEEVALPTGTVTNYGTYATFTWILDVEQCNR